MKRILALLVLAGCTQNNSINDSVRHHCAGARLDSAWVVGLLLSDKLGDREAADRIYDGVLFQQRVCTLFTTPFLVDCHDVGCRAATLAEYQLLLP